jgi:hypothetical protein
LPERSLETSLEGLPSPQRGREKEATMLIVDTHCHALPHWFEPVEVLLHQMHANGVEKALLVQVRGQFDNRYLCRSDDDQAWVFGKTAMSLFKFAG